MGREVGHLKGRRLHLGSSLEVITMSDPFSPEGDPEVLFWPLTTSSALPCLQPALGYRFHSFHRPYVINNDNNNDDKSSDLFKPGANAPFILWPMSWQINQCKGKVNSEGKRSLSRWRQIIFAFPVWFPQSYQITAPNWDQRNEAGRVTTSWESAKAKEKRGFDWLEHLQSC